MQRTGWGKSAVYFIAAKLLREQGRGATVIVSPLLALMRNQVDAARRAGVRAATINSSNTAEWDGIHQLIASGDLDVLLVSPERLNDPEFRVAVLPSLAADAGLVVVDEAHCVSDWGHDFRPDYRRIRTLVADLTPGTPVLATTATANNRVVEDVAAQLGIDGNETVVLRGSLNRESLRLSVIRISSADRRAEWIDAQLDSLKGSGIIYTLTARGACDLAEFLEDSGHDVAAYTGQTDPDEREQLEAALLNNRVKALVATSALGMGFDKPDLGFVIHLGSPASPITYYQQVGRAGRSLSSAEAVLLPGREDRDTWNYFTSMGFPSQAVVRRLIDALDLERPQLLENLQPIIGLDRYRLEMVLKVLDVDGAVTQSGGGWIRTGAPWHYDEPRYHRIDEARRQEQQVMLEYQVTAGCRMAFLRAQLDDPELDEDDSCGRCDNCAGDSHLSVDAPRIRWLNELRDELVQNLLAHAVVNVGRGRPGPPLEVQRWGPTGNLVGVTNSRGGYAGKIRRHPAREARLKMGRGKHLTFLLMANEFDRPAAVEALSREGIDLPVDESPGWLNASVEPGLHGWLDVYWSGNVAGLNLKPRLATFHIETGELTVFAAPLADSVELLLRRVGQPPTTVVVEPDSHDPEYFFGIDILEVIAEQTLDPGTPRQLRPVARALLPTEWAELLEKIWNPEQPRIRVPAEVMGDQPPGGPKKRATEPRGGLTRAGCRLCTGSSGGEPYCRQCVQEAASGLFYDRGCDESWIGAVCWSLRTLADNEFNGPPAVSQLQQPPGGAGDADLLMLCRMLTCRQGGTAWGADRKAYSWTGWLAEAGLLPGNPRTSSGSSVNAWERTQRTERCRLAVELQAGGLTIKQIAEQFGVGAPTVTSLLRDGKFYADPSSDPQRYELVRQAADLRSKELTPTQVGVELKLSGAKAKESWRDTGVLFAHARPPVDLTQRDDDPSIEEEQRIR